VTSLHWLYEDKGFPLFKLGFQRGIIVEQKTVREHPIGKIAERTIGYERQNSNGTTDGKGIEWAYKKYLNGKDGKILKQKKSQRTVETH
jgi:cell division protein FtsI (penicillin-binding protein 3)